MSFPSISWTDTQTILLFLVVFLLISEQMKNRKPQNFPPGPTCYPFLGNIFSLDATQLHLQLTKMSDNYGNIFSLRLGGTDCVVINTYTKVKEALVDQADTFSGRPPNEVFKKINKCQDSGVFFNIPIVSFYCFGKLLGTGISANNGYSWKQQRRFILSTLKNFGVGKRNLECSIKEEFNFLYQTIMNTEGRNKTLHKTGTYYNNQFLILIYSKSILNYVCALFIIIFSITFLGKPFDAHYLINNAVSNIICSLVFGKRFEYTDKRFLNMLNLMSKGLKLQGSLWTQLYNSFPNLMELFPGPHKDMVSYFKQLCNFLNEEIKNHRAEWNPSSPRDFIDCYLSEIEKNDPEAGFHEQGLCDVLLDLFVAGTETTSTTLLWSFIYMMKYPEIQEKVQAEIDRVIGSLRQPCMADRPNMPYTDAVIHEIQRMANILPLNLPRFTSKNTTLGGYFIPKKIVFNYLDSSLSTCIFAFLHIILNPGTQIIPNLTSVLFDETQWKSPHSFNPQNFLNLQGEFVKPNAFLPFSAGKRACPGESLARMELFLFFTSFFQVFTLSPPVGTKTSLEYEFGITLSPKPFKMTARPRGQSSSQCEGVSASQ
uniref:Uncharacterized protein n=1 Tax=Electrophorus electricus TaxID=8005 RepID=A0A4W4FUV1_ELEEL